MPHRLNNAFRLFRIGKMGHQRHAADILQRPQLLPDAVNPIRLKTEPVHAAVHFQVDIERGVQLRILQRLNLPVAVHAGGQTIFIKQRQFIAVEKAFEHQDRPFPAALAQQDRLFQIEHRKAIGRT